MVGVGGAWRAIITRMAQKEGIKTAEFIVINTDAQDLEYAQARKKIYIKVTNRFGGGDEPGIRQTSRRRKSFRNQRGASGGPTLFYRAG